MRRAKIALVLAAIALAVYVMFYFITEWSYQRSVDAGLNRIHKAINENKGDVLLHGVYEIYDRKDGSLKQIQVPVGYINGVRWYKDEPQWCIIAVGNKEYVVDKSGPATWEMAMDERRKKETIFQFDIKHNNKDPYSGRKR